MAGYRESPRVWERDGECGDAIDRPLVHHGPIPGQHQVPHSHALHGAAAAQTPIQHHRLRPVADEVEQNHG